MTGESISPILSVIFKGTSWLVEICWLLLHGINIDRVKELNATDRYVFLEMTSQPSAIMEPPFVAETHVLFETARKLVEDKKKVIVGIRNPKDTLVSWYHFCRMNKVMGLFPGNWSQFMTLYKAGKIPYGDYFDNVLSWWNERHRENILVVFYEDVKHQPFSTIKNISAFLGKDYSDSDIQRVVDWTAFSNIKNQPMSNYTKGRIATILKPEISPYMRKGTPGDWKNYFRNEDNIYIDE